MQADEDSDEDEDIDDYTKPLNSAILTTSKEPGLELFYEWTKVHYIFLLPNQIKELFPPQ